MPIDQRELYVEHTLDVAWIITLWNWIHGGDPLHDSEAELLARGLVAHLSKGAAGSSQEVVEKLAQLGIKVTLKSNDEQTEVKTTREFHDRMKATGKPLPIPCFIILNGHRGCWSPLWELFPPRELKR